MALLLVSNISGIRVLPVEGLTGRDRSCLHHGPFDQRDGCIPGGKFEIEKLILEKVLFESLRDKKRAPYFWIIWRIELNNPVDCWDVQTTSSHVCAQKNAGFGITELEECGGAFRLLLLALQRKTSKNSIIYSII